MVSNIHLGGFFQLAVIPRQIIQHIAETHGPNLAEQLWAVLAAEMFSPSLFYLPWLSSPPRKILRYLW